MRLAFIAPAALTSLLLLVLAAPVMAQPQGEGCRLGPGLGSTLLFPYFETDLDDFDGPATLISFSNRGGNAAMVRVVLWTDWGNPTLAFDVYMPSFKVQSLNLRDTLNGGVPSTGAGEDLSAFENCDINPPDHSNPALTPDQIAQLQADHTGQLGPLADNCAGSPHSDRIARGYITIDVVDECNGIEGFNPQITPANTDRPYFANGAGTGVAKNDNRLWGDIFYLSNESASAQGSLAIPIWSDPAAFSGNDIFTFYGRYSNWDGRDNRVPLPHAWDQRFLNGGPFAGGADLIVYQDTGQPPTYANCGNTPGHFPLQGTVFSINDPGDNIIDLSSEFDELAGKATQRGPIESLSIPYAFGWTELDAGDAQMWVQPALSASGLYSASLDGTPVGFLCGIPAPSAASESTFKAYEGRPGAR